MFIREQFYFYNVQYLKKNSKLTYTLINLLQNMCLNQNVYENKLENELYYIDTINNYVNDLLKHTFNRA